MGHHKKNIREAKSLFGSIIRNVSQLHEQVVDEQMDITRINLGKDEKDAWIKRIADQYMKKQSIEEPPPELEITQKNILSELARRTIINKFSKG